MMGKVLGGDLDRLTLKPRLLLVFFSFFLFRAYTVLIIGFRVLYLSV